MKIKNPLSVILTTLLDNMETRAGIMDCEEVFVYSSNSQRENKTLKL
jgi:hypothetical protein